jgi:hypothetical protein
LDDEAWKKNVFEVCQALLEDDKATEAATMPTGTKADAQAVFEFIASHTSKHKIDAVLALNSIATHGSKTKCVERLARFGAGL